MFFQEKVPLFFILAPDSEPAVGVLPDGPVSGQGHVENARSGYTAQGLGSICLHKPFVSQSITLVGFVDWYQYTLFSDFLLSHSVEEIGRVIFV